MFKTSSITFFLITLVSFGCDTKYELKNTEWLTTKFTIDSSNYLTEFDKEIYLGYDISRKLHIKFLDILALTSVENGHIDTITLFYIQGSRKDTSIILKLTGDSLIEHRLAGVVTHNAKFKPK